jgi:hypothetical protein
MYLICKRIGAGITMEWQVSNFFAKKKGKWNENLESKNGTSKMKTETNYFCWRWKEKGNNVFRRNIHGNETSVPASTGFPLWV